MKTILYTTTILVLLITNVLFCNDKIPTKIFIISTYPYYNSRTYPYIYGILDELQKSKIPITVRYVPLVFDENTINEKYIFQKCIQIKNKLKEYFPDIVILIGDIANEYLFDDVSTSYITYSLGTLEKYHGIYERFSVQTFLDSLKSNNYAFSNIYILDKFTSKCSTFRAISQQVFLDFSKNTSFGVKKYLIEKPEDFTLSIKSLECDQSGILINLMDMDTKISCLLHYKFPNKIQVCFDDVLCKYGCDICISPDKYREGQILVQRYIIPLILKGTQVEHNMKVECKIYVNKKTLSDKWFYKFIKDTNVYKIFSEFKCQVYSKYLQK